MIKDSINLQFAGRTDKNQDKFLETDYAFGRANVTTHNEWSRKTDTGFRLHAAVSENETSSLGWSLPDPKTSATLEFSARLAVAESVPVQLTLTIKRGRRTVVNKMIDIAGQDATPVSVDIPRYSGALEITLSAVSTQRDPKPKHAVLDLTQPVLRTWIKPGRLRAGKAA